MQKKNKINLLSITKSLTVAPNTHMDLFQLIYHSCDHLVISSFIHPINTYSAPTMWYRVDSDLLVYHSPYSPQAYNRRDDNIKQVNTEM